MVWGLKCALEELRARASYNRERNYTTAGSGQMILSCRCWHRVLPGFLWWEVRIAVTNQHVLEPTVSFDLTWTPWGLLVMKICPFYSWRWPQPPRSLEHLNLFPEHHCMVVVNVDSEPNVTNVSSGTGRWGQTMWCESEGGVAPQKKNWGVPERKE